MNTDGSAQQQYLACDGLTSRCVEADAPVIPGYLQACDSATLANHAKPNSVGGVEVVAASLVVRGLEACLIAWDDAAQVARSGITHVCVGDWQCPQNSICDPVMRLDTTSSAWSVCKPGPRGTLSPSMLQ